MFHSLLSSRAQLDDEERTLIDLEIVAQEQGLILTQSRPRRQQKASEAQQQMIEEQYRSQTTGSDPSGEQAIACRHGHAEDRARVDKRHKI